MNSRLSFIPDGPDGGVSRARRGHGAAKAAVAARLAPESYTPKLSPGGSCRPFMSPGCNEHAVCDARLTVPVGWMWLSWEK